MGRLWSHLRGRRHGDFMWCFTGRHFYPLDPSAADVHIEDIAWGLANECRYAGHSQRYYSVAEHSVLVSRSCFHLGKARGLDPMACALAGLLHDATESYVGDLIRPLKYQRELRGFRRAENLIDGAIRKHFAPWMPWSKPIDALVREVDNRILVDEIAVLMKGADMNDVRKKYGSAIAHDRAIPNGTARIRGWYPNVARQEFLTEFDALCPDYSVAA